ncbi:NAC domain-containing protein 37-like [Herrania umbratica]|uniref:NAC domain-containing protein 37-like n=1 Tax=Herrania umbratica TaxID=108875 RepID=A0A6J1A584_9ROSI|nr:NAC domain-containing protein 37-like [Herrania umbratica]
MSSLGDLQYVIGFADIYSTKPSVFFDDNNGNGLPFLKSNQRFIFTHRQRISQKNANGKRPRRILESHHYDETLGVVDSGGYWRSSTAEKPILDEQQREIGFVRTLNFLEFKDEKKSRKDATKTRWLMHEYRLPGDRFQEWVICKIKDTSRSPHDKYSDSIWMKKLFGKLLLPHSDKNHHHQDEYQSQIQPSTVFNNENLQSYEVDQLLDDDLFTEVDQLLEIDDNRIQTQSSTIFKDGNLSSCEVDQLHEKKISKDDDPFKEVDQLLEINDDNQIADCPFKEMEQLLRMNDNDPIADVDEALATMNFYYLSDLLD